MRKTRSLTLQRPLTLAKGVRLKALKIKEPTGAQIVQFGDPFDRISRGGKETSEINHRVATAYLLECAMIPAEALAKLSAIDFANALAETVQFFVEAGGPPDPWAYYAELTDRFHWSPSEVSAMPLNECMRWYVQTAERDAKRAAEREDAQTNWD